MEKKISIIEGMIDRNDFLGGYLIDLYNDDELKKEIIKRGEDSLKKSIEKRVNINKNVLIAALIIISLDKYDGEFYKHIQDEFSDAYDLSPNKSQSVDGIIRGIISNNTQIKDADGSRIINRILIQTLVPIYYLEGFFKFIFDIYKLNFNCDIENLMIKENLEVILQSTFNNENLEKNDLVFNVIDGKAKTYNLIKSTKCALNNVNYRNETIAICANILKMLDAYYWDENVPFLDNRYFKYGFEIWQEAHEKSSEKIKKGRQQIERKGNRRTPTLTFNNVNNEVYLNTPHHQILDINDFKELKMRIYNNEKILVEFNEDLDISRIFGGFQINYKQVVLDDPLGSIKYEVLNNDTVMYSSDEKLFRKTYIVFDMDGRELKEDSDYVGNINIISSFKLNEDEFDFVKENSRYYVYSKYVQIGDELIINGDFFSLSKCSKPGFKGVEINNVTAYVGSKKTALYSSMSSIVFQSKESMNNICLVINGKNLKLDNKNSIESYNNGYYTIKVNDLRLNDKTGLYNISVMTKNSTKKLFDIEPYFLDKNFECYIEPTSNKHLMRVNISSSFSLSDFNKNEIIDIIEIDIRNEDNLKFYLDKIYEDKISYYLELGIEMYSIKYGEWKLINESFWHAGIKDIIISGIDAYSVVLLDSNKEFKCNLNFEKIECNNNIKIKTDMFKNYIMQNSSLFIRINSISNHFDIECCINNKLDVENIKIDEGRDLKLVIPYDEELCRNSMIVSLLNGDGSIIKQNLTCHEVIFRNLISGLNLKIEINQVNSNPFVAIRNDIVLFKYEFSHLSNDYLIDKSIVLYLAVLESFDKRNNKIVTKTLRMEDTYLDIVKKIDDNNFIGYAFRICFNKKEYFGEAVNPVRAEVINLIDRDGFFLSLTNYDNENINSGDGLLYDSNLKSISNIDDGDLEDIYEIKANFMEER